MMQGGNEMAAHFQHKDWQRQHQPDPEAAGHVGQLRAGAAIGRHHQGFQRHAANRATACTVLADFGVHRAGPDGAFGHLGRGRLAGREIAGRIGLELGLAACRAEIIGLALGDQLMLGRRGINRHAADRIGYERSVGRVIVVLVIMMSVFAHWSDLWNGRSDRRVTTSAVADA